MEVLTAPQPGRNLWIKILGRNQIDAYAYKGPK